MECTPFRASLKSVQGLIEKDGCNGVEYEANLRGIGGASDVRVYLLPLRVSVCGEELMSYEFESLLVVETTSVLREATCDVHALDLLSEDIVLVQEEDHAHVLEPHRITDFIKEFERLVHAIHTLVLV